jgi:hypothetical protein
MRRRPGGWERLFFAGGAWCTVNDCAMGCFVCASDVCWCGMFCVWDVLCWDVSFQTLYDVISCRWVFRDWMLRRSYFVMITELCCPYCICLSHCLQYPLPALTTSSHTGPTNSRRYPHPSHLLLPLSAPVTPSLLTYPKYSCLHLPQLLPVPIPVSTVCTCSLSSRRGLVQEDKRMVLEYTHGLFIT